MESEHNISSSNYSSNPTTTTSLQERRRCTDLEPVKVKTRSDIMIYSNDRDLNNIKCTEFLDCHVKSSSYSDWDELPDLVTSANRARLKLTRKFDEIRTPNSTNDIIDTADPKTKGIIRMFLLFWHASNCDGIPLDSPEFTPSCRCASWKALSGSNRENVRSFLKHMSNCDDDDCGVLHCSLTRSVLRHINNCSNIACDGCNKIRATQQIIPPLLTPVIGTESALADAFDIVNVLASMRDT